MPRYLFLVLSERRDAGITISHDLAVLIKVITPMIVARRLILYPRCRHAEMYALALEGL